MLAMAPQAHTVTNGWVFTSMLHANRRCRGVLADMAGLAAT
jgi:hypothetical protein